jgi:hypothetical protein
VNDRLPDALITTAGQLLRLGRLAVAIWRATARDRPDQHPEPYLVLAPVVPIHARRPR